MPLGTKVGLSLGNIVTWGSSSPHKNGAQPPNFRPMPLWPNGRPSQLLLSTYYFFHWNEPFSCQIRCEALTRMATLLSAEHLPIQYCLLWHVFCFAAAKQCWNQRGDEMTQTKLKYQWMLLKFLFLLVSLPVFDYALRAVKLSSCVIKRYWLVMYISSIFISLTHVDV